MKLTTKNLYEIKYWKAAKQKYNQTERSKMTQAKKLSNLFLKWKKFSNIFGNVTQSELSIKKKNFVLPSSDKDFDVSPISSSLLWKWILI